MFSNLCVFTGPMFSGKTESLLKEILWSSFFVNDPASQPRCLVLKPAMDVRYASNEIVSHAGARAAATPVSSLEGIDFTQYERVFIDEMQFFDAPHVEGDLVAEVRRALIEGVKVYASGLDLDYRGEPFRVSADMIAMAGDVRRMSSCCDLCGADAQFTARFSASRSRVDLGAAESYKALCQRHWIGHVRAQGV